MSSRRICIVVGTRPEIIKMSPVIRVCRERRRPFYILHTNQHYDPQMDAVFFAELGLPAPDYNLQVGAGRAAPAAQLAQIISGVADVLRQEPTSVTLVQGDTMTVLGAALAANQCGVPIGHVEAGLRSRWLEMPEEINRKVVDHISDLLLAPTAEAKANLLAENCPPERIEITGNTITDALAQHLELIRQPPAVPGELEVESGRYLLATIHRHENTDDWQALRDCLARLGAIADAKGLPIVFPVHPRTARLLHDHRISLQAPWLTCPPVGYLTFLGLLKHCRLVFTDSGGIQEEACILRVPAVTLRDNTERPESLAVGGNVLAGRYGRDLAAAVDQIWDAAIAWRNPFGDGHAAEAIVDALQHRRLCET